jgi:tape measure domain-containing protein
MAKAVGVTEKELAAMMKSGQLLTDEVLPSLLDN